MVNLFHELKIEQLDTLLQYAHKKLKESLESNIIQDQWNNEEFKSGFYNFSEMVRKLNSDNVFGTSIGFQLCTSLDLELNNELVSINANHFLIFIALGSKGFIENLETNRELSKTLKEIYKEDSKNYFDLFEELQGNLNNFDLHSNQAIITLHLDGFKPFDYYDDEDYY